MQGEQIPESSWDTTNRDIAADLRAALNFAQSHVGMPEPPVDPQLEAVLQTPSGQQALERILVANGFL